MIEDDAALARSIAALLRAGGHAVDHVATGEDALAVVGGEPYALVILDVGLPDIDGFTVLAELRRRGEKVPVLMLTARDALDDKLLGFRAGADDYLVKPFQFEELEARLNALLRRSSGFTQSTIAAGPLVLDLNRKQATLDDQPLALTAYEYRILEYLMRHHQQVVAKDRLMEQLYPGDEERDPNVIEVLVGRLRRKLEGEQGFKPIDTVRGLGYLFTERCR